jgi:putative DNA primase/helicase
VTPAYIHQTRAERAAGNGHVNDVNDVTGSTRSAPLGAGPDGFRYTDVGNAERLIAAHGDRLRYVPRWRRWLVWDGRRWAIDADNVAVVELAKDVPRQLLAEVTNVPSDERKRLVAHATRSEAASALTNLVSLARTLPGIAVDHDQLDADPWDLNVLNGTIDLRTGQLTGPDPDRLVTRLAGCAFDPGATAPRFTRFLERIFPDPDLRAYLQRWAGYCATGDVGEQALGLWWGTGRNGKSTLLAILAAALGDYATTVGRDLLVQQRHDTHDTKFVDLFRTRLAYCTETEDGHTLDAARVKALTGGDPIRARRMREDFWRFDPTHKLVLATNFRPRANSEDFALWRRVHLVPFTEIIPAEDVDPDLAATIIDTELEGVLAWIVDGTIAWRHGRLAAPGAVTAATATYRDQADTVALFLREAGVELDPDGRCPSSHLQDAHDAWCTDQGENPVAHWKKVAARLKEQGATPRRTGASGRFWAGVRLADNQGG